MNTRRAIGLPLLSLVTLVGCSSNSAKSGSAPASAPAAAGADSATQSASAKPNKPLDWKFLEAPLLTNHVQLTSREKFVKAGEAYFDHSSPPRWVVFQAVPVPEAGRDADLFYSMYVARLRYDKYGISGIDTPVKISPEGSANTCGWFDPAVRHRVIFGSTLTRPSNTQRPGFQVGTRNYVWMFPHEMEVVSRSVPDIYRDLNSNAPQPQWTGDALAAKPVFNRPNYDAECSLSKNGRFLLYSHVRDEPTGGKDDADIWVYDTQTGEQHEIVHADGYDGGPFFSPDNKRICYRSDRVGNDLLQLFVADLKFDDKGVPIGIEHEYQVTNNEHVNWAPFWHPSGAFLIYGTSEVGHDNYEIFAVEAPPRGFDGFDRVPKGPGEFTKVPVTLGQRRITYANGADVLPVFSDKGEYMMWTAQRGPMVEGEAKPSSQVWVAQFADPIPSIRWHAFFQPRFDPPKSKADARAIALKVMHLDEKELQGWTVETEAFEGGWRVHLQGPYVDSMKNILIHANGTITRISP